MSHELTAETPWQTVTRLAEAAATGELIVASDAIEIHVYLLDGRLAWATCSTARNEFLRCLIERHEIANDVLRDMIEQCRRMRGRFGEMLVTWGVATEDQVRDALRRQIEEALAVAVAHPGARCLFLPQRLDYAIELTVSVTELELGVNAVTAASGGTPPSQPASTSDGQWTPVSSSYAAQRIVTTVLDRIPDALWVEAVERGAWVARAVRCTAGPADTIQEVQRLLTDHDIEALTLRSSVHGAVLGQRLPGLSSAVWCAVGGGAKLGVISAVLASAVGAHPLAPAADAADEPWHEIVEPGARLRPSVFAGATRTCDELVAGFALGGCGGPTGVWRGSLGLDVHAAWARRLAPALASAIRDSFPRSAESSLYDHVALRAIVGNVAYYGALLPDSSVAVWLALRTWTLQGVGWALLQTVARQVGGEA